MPITSTARDLLERMQEFLDEKEEKKYVLIEQEQLNHYSANPCAHDKHIFDADGHGKVHKSCCGKFTVPRDLASKYGEVLKAPLMRKKVANIGRSVCGICVSTLYGNND